VRIRHAFRRRFRDRDSCHRSACPHGLRYGFRLLGPFGCLIDDHREVHAVVARNTPAAPVVPALPDMLAVQTPGVPVALVPGAAAALVRYTPAAQLVPDAVRHTSAVAAGPGAAAAAIASVAAPVWPYRRQIRLVWKTYDHWVHLMAVVAARFGVAAARRPCSERHRLSW
jgi:hypothetical protein